MGMTKKDLARKIGCAQSTMNDTLTNPQSRHSSLVPAIHAAIGWDPPPDPQSPPLPSSDAAGCREAPLDPLRRASLRGDADLMDRRRPVRRVSKAEFVWLMISLARVDRERYRELRDFGWLNAGPLESDIPN